MKLLFDDNISYKILKKIGSVYNESVLSFKMYVDNSKFLIISISVNYL